MKMIWYATLSCFMLIACKPAGLDSSLADIATSNRIKTGFFMPKLPEDLAYGNPKRVEDPMQLMAMIGLKYTREPGEAFVVATTPEGENILVVSRLRRPPTPIASLGADGKKYLWSYMQVREDESGYRFESNLYVKHAINQKPTRQVSADGNHSNMFFLRNPNTNDGGRESVLINWVDHILAGGSNLLYRIGNIVYIHGAEAPILRYDEIGNQVWQMDGAYKDNDVGPGTIFWTTDRKIFYSLNPNGNALVKWTKQDKDSMDRTGRIDPDSIRIPEIVLRNAKKAKESNGFSLAAGNGGMSYFGMDWSKPYRGAIPLLQHSAIFKARAQLGAASHNGLNLTAPRSIDESSDDFDAFFEFPEVNAATGFGLSGPHPGIPVFNPKNAYSYGHGASSKQNWVQVENPPGSGIYKVAVVQQQSNQTRVKDGFLWNSEVKQRNHKLQILEPNGKGGYTPNGQVANLKTEGGKVITRDWSHVAVERAKIEAERDKSARAVAQAQEEFKFKSAEGGARMEAAEKNYDEFAKQYRIEENLKYAVGETIDVVADKANAGRPPAFDFQEKLTRDAAKALTKEGANVLIDSPRALANGETPITMGEVADKATNTLAGSASSYFIPVKLPDGGTKSAVEAVRSIGTGWAVDQVQSGAQAGFDTVTGTGATGPSVAGDLDGDGQLSASERGRLAGQAGADSIDFQTATTQGVLDVGFSVAKDAAKDPNSAVAVRVLERGSQIGNQGLGTYRQFDGANNAFLEAGQAHNQILQHNSIYGSEGMQAQAQMEQDFQSPPTYNNPWQPAAGAPQGSAQPAQPATQPVTQPSVQPINGGGQIAP